MKKSDFVVRFAGEGGQGLLTSATAFAQAHTKIGYHSQTFATFPSQIVGGPTWMQARISTSEIRSRGDELDVLVAFNKEAYNKHKAEVGEHGVVIYHSGEFTLEDDSRSLGLPLTTLAKSTGNPRSANFVVMGALAQLANIPISVFEDFNKTKFSRGRDGDDHIIESNNTALRLGMEEAAKSNFSLGQLSDPIKPD